ncbi:MULTISPECIES: polysaccharide lyase 8 family protein [Arthrobacter]|uniref:Polysaccharide lyase 8 family protein n=2 Tax=Arthrobacter TaxID=1663 RepID=A0ABU9KME4_9MICC|nr:polysaccharide lyase 8 family protein [Arthrobacter sp. YJM1]MDP5227996.1 polysaccharide lyase 8 family protein [Arthrobacter sp. YJM1]
MSPTELNRRTLFALLGAGALVAASAQTATAAPGDDPLAALIERRRLMLVGDGSAASVPALSAALTAMSGTAASLWSSMITPGGTSGLWSDLPLTGIGSGADATGNMGVSFDRVFSLALAYGTAGADQHADPALASALVSALSYLNTTAYKAGMRAAGNWWFWEIGVPRKAADTLVLLHDVVPADLRTSLMAAARYFTPDPNWRGRGTSLAETGANRSDKSLSCILRGMLDGRPDEIALARDALSDTVRAGKNSVFGYVSGGDGFYRDGSFVQHSYLPYVGTYGVVTLGGIAEILGLLGGSDWDVTDPDKSVILDSVEASFAPFIWNGRMMDAVRGRAVSRQKNPDHVDGAAALTAILLLAPGAGEPYRSRYLSLVKGWLNRAGVTLYGLPGQTIAKSLLITANLADGSITPAPAPVFTKAFGDQDRLVHHRPDFSSVVNVSSKRIGRYEWGNFENNQGWYQGDGLTYYYVASDPGQYSADFWPTVDPYRLPGTTVTAEPRSSGAANGTGIPRAFQAFAGGLDLDGRWGIQGMDHLNFNKTLSARKSWFFLDDKVVCLGAGITSTSGYDVFTTVDNRAFAQGTVPNIRTDNRNRVMAAGDTAVRVKRNAHIMGYGGYVFLPGENVSGDIDVQVIRCTGDWKTINSGSDTGGTADPKTRDYVTVTHHHGKDPQGGGYAYIALPGAAHPVTFTESDAPTVTVVANNAGVQAIKDATQNLTLANVFQATPAGEPPASGIIASGPCSVAVHEESGTVTVALSDPSRTQPLAQVTLTGVSASAVVDADPGVTVLSTAPLAVQFALDGHGHAKKVTLSR